MTINFKQYETERLYPIGFKFSLKRGKQDVKEMEIVDYAISHNSKGEVTQFYYECSYLFAKQRTVSFECQATIDIATNNGWKNLVEKSPNLGTNLIGTPAFVEISEQDLRDCQKIIN